MSLSSLFYHFSSFPSLHHCVWAVKSPDIHVRSYQRSHHQLAQTYGLRACRTSCLVYLLLIASCPISSLRNGIFIARTFPAACSVAFRTRTTVIRSSFSDACLLNVEISRVGYLSRKALPIKKNDAEALTRVDVQFDLLNYIFSDSKAVFTNQTPGKTTKLTFCDLYVNALFNSTKCSKVLKEKMIETPQFAIELAKISLLTNVGRINTTMACASFQ